MADLSKELSGHFGVIFYSKVVDAQGYQLTAGNLRALFEHLAQTELVRRVYLVDDSHKDFQEALIETFSSIVAQTCPAAEVVRVTGNGTMWNAVNRVWSLIQEEYVIQFLSDFRMIEVLPLCTIAKVFMKYRQVYLIYLRVRGLYGYNDTVKAQLKQTYAWYRDYPDDEREVWYCRDTHGRVYSIPHRLYVKQCARQEVLPKELWGVQLVPRIIDADNTLWTPKLPSMLLPTRPVHESFAGGPVVLRTKVVKKYLPLPEKYKDRPAADCLETYFWTTDIDQKFYTGYLNLQAFAIQFGDPKRPLQDVQREYWQEFRQRNCCPIVYKSASAWKVELQLWLIRAVHFLLLTSLRSKARSRIRAILARVSRRLPVLTRLPWGGAVLAWNDVMGQHLRKRDNFEQGEQSFLLQFLRPGMTVLDIGAHHGFYTLLASRKVGPPGKVIAFEPSPRELRRLRWNLLLNRCRNVRVVPSALGSSEGRTEFLGQETGCNSLCPPAVSEPISKVQVPITTLNRYLERARINKVDFVKMDVEGAELDVLKGAQRLLRDCKPLLLCELADVRTGPWGYRSVEIYDFLKSCGYRWFSIAPDGRLQPCPRKERFHENLIAVPEEKLGLVAVFVEESGEQCIELP